MNCDDCTEVFDILWVEQGSSQNPDSDPGGSRFKPKSDSNFGLRRVYVSITTVSYN